MSYYSILKNKNILFVLSIFFLVFCIVIDPIGLHINKGFSYYGTMAKTLLPYTISLILMSILIYPHKNKYKFYLNNIFKTISLLYLLLIIFPYSISNVFNTIHISIGSSLFALQLISSLFIYFYLKNRSFLYSFLILLIFGICCGLFIIYPKGYLIQFQVLYQITFLITYLNFIKYNKNKKNFK